MYVFITFAMVVVAVSLTMLFSDSDYTASNEGVISEWWIGKDVEESGRGL